VASFSAVMEKLAKVAQNARESLGQAAGGSQRNESCVPHLSAIPMPNAAAVSAIASTHGVTMESPLIFAGETRFLAGPPE